MNDTNNNTADLPNSATADLPNSATADLPNSATVDLPNSATADLPNSATADLPNSAADEKVAEESTRVPVAIPRLSDLCVKEIAKNFQFMPILDKIPKNYVEPLLELLETDLPLTLTVPLLEESIFWKRACEERWSTMNYVADYGSSWKRIYLERHLQEFLENLDPDEYSEDQMMSVVRLCAPFILRLRLCQLVHSRKMVPRRFGGKPEEGDPLSHDHINLKSCLSGLPKLEELDVVFGMRKLGLELKTEYFMFSKQDCNNIGLGMTQLESIKEVHIHRSLLDNGHLASLVQYIIFVKTLEHVDFSNCLISDDGGMIIGQLLRVHENLKKIVLTNNKIGMDGSHFLACALTETRCKLKLLDFRLNPIGDAGVAYLCSALAVSEVPEELNISGCGIAEKGAKKVSRMLMYNKCLKVLNLSNNSIGEQGVEAVLLALSRNISLVQLDMRMTGLSGDQELRLSEFLKRNQGKLEISDSF
ncbi:dynein regulatory complex subunit 5 [Bacillus rossius redtenbacheri]|uniref:dynein regulatory complex subunit 5 n=1 Tax=Bacillus rossius redtenbacheri TaxID=93214 RepID=UPI002FDE4AE7